MIEQILPLPEGKLGDVIRDMPARRRAAFMEHLVGGTSAEYLSDWLRRAGTPVGATTIKTYRRALERGEGQPARRAAE